MERMKAHAMAQKPHSLTKKKINFNIRLHKNPQWHVQSMEKNEEQNLGLLLP